MPPGILGRVIYEHEQKALANRFMASTPTANYGVPTVKEVSSSIDGTGLELSGYFATWDVDSENEAFHPSAFTSSLPRALALGIPVLYNHLKNESPIGFVKSAEVRPDGLWGCLILPKPTIGTKAFDVYSAIQSGSMGNVSFSVGGLWQRFDVAGKIKLLCKRLLEVSVTPIATNEFAVATGVQSAVGVKSLGNGPDALWVRASMPYTQKLDALTAHRRRRALETAVARVSLELSVCEINRAAGCSL